MGDFEQLLHLIKSGESSVSGDALTALLDERSDRFLTGAVNPFDKASSAAERARLCAEDVHESALALVEGVAVMLNVDFGAIFRLLQSYLLSAGLQYAQLAGEREKTAAIAELNRQCASERLAFYACLCALIKSEQRQHDTDSNMESLASTARTYLHGPTFINALMRQYEDAITGKLFLAAGYNEITADFGDLSLRLQTAITEVLLWRFQLFADVTVDELLACLELFKRYDFGALQPLGGGAASADRARSLRRLQLLFVVRAFEVDGLTARALGAAPDGEYRWLVDGALGRLEALLQTVAAEPLFAPVYMVWSVVVEMVSADSLDYDKEIKVQRLTSLAREHGACSQLKRLLDDPLVSQDEDLRSLANAVVYAALDGFLCVYEPISLEPEFDALMSAVLAERSLADDFWDRQFGSGLSQYVRDTLYRFPMCFVGSLEILTSLANAAAHSAAKAAALLQRLPCYSESEVDTDPRLLVDVGADDDDTFRLAVDRRFYEDTPPGMLLSAGTLCRVRNSPGAGEQTKYVEWSCFVNGWQLCLFELQRVLLGSKLARAERAEAACRFLAAVIGKDAGSSVKYVHLIDAIVEMLCRCHSDAAVPLSLLAAGVECAAAVGSRHGVDVLDRLSAGGFLPRLTRSATGEAAVSGGVVERVLSEREIESGSFAHSVAFLRLLLNCCRSAASHSSLGASFLFLLRSVLPAYHRWAFVDEDQRDDFSDALLQIFHLIIQRHKKDSSETSVASSSWTCVNELLNGDARHNLLGFACVGHDALAVIMSDGTTCSNASLIAARRRSFSMEGARAQKIVLRALSILALLLDWGEAARTSALGADLFAKSASAQSAVAVFAGYLQLNNDSRIAKLALVCLRKLAPLFPATMTTALADATGQTCDTLLARLGSPLEDTQLKIYAFELVAACVRSQPALAERLCDAADDGFVTALRRTVGAVEQVPQLLLAAYGLVLTLWQQRHQAALDRLADWPQFWSTVCAPLAAGESTYFLRLVSLILRIAAEELHRCREKGSPLGELPNSVQLGLLFGGQIPAELRKVLETSFLPEDRLKLFFHKLSELLSSHVERPLKEEILRRCGDFSSLLTMTDGLLQPPLQTLWLSQFVAALERAVVPDSAELVELEFGVISGLGWICGALLSAWSQYDCWQRAAKKAASPYSQMDEATIDLLHGAAEKLCLHTPPYLLPTAAELLAPSLHASLTVCASRAHTRRADRLLPTLVDLSERLLGLQLNVASASDSVRERLRRSTNESLTCLRALITEERCELWLTALKKRQLLRSLVVVFQSQLRIDAVDRKYIAVVCEVFAAVLQSRNALPLVEASGILTASVLDLPAVLRLEGAPSDHDLLRRAFGLYANGLRSCGRPMLRASCTFVASFSDHLAKVLASAASTSDHEVLQTARFCMHLLLLMADFRRNVRQEIPEQCLRQNSAVGRCAAGLIDTISRSHLIEQKSKVGEKKAASETSSVDSISSQRLQKRRMSLLHVCMLYLKKLSPSIYDVCGNDHFDGNDYDVLLSASFCANEEDGSLSYGCVLHCIQLCATQLRKTDTRSASPAPSFALVADLSLLALLLECCVELVVAQTMVYLRRADVPAADRAPFARQVGRELTQLVARCLRHADSPSTPRAHSPSTSSPHFDQQFFRLVQDIVTQFLQV